MPRQPRVELAGGIHHVTAHATENRTLFADEADFRAYLHHLTAAARRCRWRLLNFCQMHSHIHLLVQTPRPNLGKGIRLAHKPFADVVNQRRGEKGHLFRERFFSRVVSDDRDLAGVMRYIGRNPLEAGICRRADEWPWSASGSLMGTSTPWAFVDVIGALGLIGDTLEEGRGAYVQWVHESDEQLLARLRIECGDTWPAAAIGSYRVPAESIRTATGWSERTLRRRLRGR